LNLHGCLGILELCIVGVWGERFENAALRNRAVAALPDQRIQFPAQRGKVGELPFHIRQMFAGNGVHGFAGLLCLVGKIEQRPNLLYGKSEVARAPGKGKAADVPG
jgi:hypothetical protein